MTQTEFRFDVAEGRKQRDAGIAQASDMLSRRFLLELARDIATLHARKHGSVTYDDVYSEMSDKGFRPDLLGNAAGSVFRGKEWQFTGEWRQSERVSNHARVNRVWRRR